MVNIKADLVMDMPGGGAFQLKPGQVTDDSELAFHLLKVLSEFKGKLDEDKDRIILNIAH